MHHIQPQRKKWLPDPTQKKCKGPEQSLMCLGTPSFHGNTENQVEKQIGPPPTPWGKKIGRLGWIPALGRWSGAWWLGESALPPPSFLFKPERELTTAEPKT